MTPIESKFARLATDHAPGQEVRQTSPAFDANLRGGWHCDGFASL